ncbi:hypothetical protein BGZ73_003461 [Actinomortierella ambigua]|nr:hypothetical protein BGZ73_003461 [Actinomortierella ambigua]
MEDPAQQCIGWIYKLFGECATTQQHAWSIVLGYASIFAWLNAQIPQIIENFKLGSAESLSLPFLVNWLLGDLCNLLGCYLTNQLPFQKYLAIYFCLADIILFCQWIYYTRQHNRRKALPDILIATMPEISEMSYSAQSRSHTPPPRIENTDTMRSKRSRSTTVTGASLRGGGMAVSSAYFGEDGDMEQGMVLGGGGEQLDNVAPLLQRSRPRRATTTEEIAHRRSTSIVLFGLMLLTLRSTVPTESNASMGAGRMLMMAGRVVKRQDDYSGGSGLQDIDNDPGSIDPAVHQLGRIFAWVCTVFYLTSRMPQLWKNYKRKSVQGLSILMFFWAAMGNFTYALSIFNSPAAVNPETSKQFLKEAVPYILGSSGTLMFDGVAMDITITGGGGRLDICHSDNLERIQGLRLCACRMRRAIWAHREPQLLEDTAHS